MTTEWTLRARQDEVAIRRQIEGWAAAVRDGDMPNIIARHASDIVMFNVPTPDVWLGLEGYRNAYALYLANNAGGPYDLSQLVLHVSGDLAFAHAMLRCGGGGPNAAPINVRLTIALQRREAEWVVVHEHHSVAVG